MSTSEISSNQAIAIKTLLEGKKQSDAAAAAGVTHRTLTRWLDNDAFTAELNHQKGQVLAAATARLVGTMDQAIDTIQEILDGFGGNAHRKGNQLRAAKIALDAALRLLEVDDLVKRVDELEKRL